MSEAKPERRSLAIGTLDDLVREIEALHARGYRKAGNWDLAQVCNHLADWMSYPMDGFPHQPAPTRFLMTILRLTFGKRMFRKILETGQIPAGGPTLKETVALPGGDEAAAVERLKGVAIRLRNHQGPLHPSPLFGPQDQATCQRLQAIHGSHHLSFLIPNEPTGTP